MSPSHTVPLVVLTKERLASLVRQSRQVLGHGASCTVYLVEVGGELCCLKVAREQSLAGMFRQEFDILLALDGAAGAPRALGTSFGRPAMLTTFCGHDTFDSLPRLAPRDADRLAAFGALARAVRQLHARGYAHNDIKSNNVVVRRDADGRLQVSLIDYGLAKKFGARHFCEGADPRLTPWMAPELFRGAPCAPSGDVFSLGCLLGRILAKCRTCHPALEELADAATAADPARRPSLARLVKTAKKAAKEANKATRHTLRKATFLQRVRAALSCFLPRRRRCRY